MGEGEGGTEKHIVRGGESCRAAGPPGLETWDWLTSYLVPLCLTQLICKMGVKSHSCSWAFMS